MAFLSHVKAYEDSHPGTRILQPRLAWKYEFLCCCLGRLSRAELEELARDIDEISNMRGRQNSWAVRSSKDFSGLLRHNQRYKLGSYMELTLEQIHVDHPNGNRGSSSRSSLRQSHLLTFPYWNQCNSGALSTSRTSLRSSSWRASHQLGCIYHATEKRITSLFATQGFLCKLLDRAGNGASWQGEVPVVDEEALRQLISDTELKEAAKQGTQTEGTTRSAYEAGDTVTFTGRWMRARPSRGGTPRDSPEGQA